MDFKVKEGRGVVAVPSHEDGAFVVNHGEHYGTRVYTEMEVAASPEVEAQVAAGDSSAVEARLQANPERPGSYKAAEGLGIVIGHVSMTVPGSRNTVSTAVVEVLEVMPAVPVSVSA